MITNTIKNTNGRQILTGNKANGTNKKSSKKAVITGAIMFLFIAFYSESAFAKISLQIKKPAIINKVSNKINQITDNSYIRKLNEGQNKYINLEELELKTNTLTKFEEINRKEYLALRPLVLQLEAKYMRLDEMDKKRCRFYDRRCKKELKKNIDALNSEITELKRQIWHKKEYYKILYINETTRQEDIKLRRLIKAATNNNPKLW